MPQRHAPEHFNRGQVIWTLCVAVGLAIAALAQISVPRAADSSTPLTTSNDLLQQQAASLERFQRKPASIPQE